MTRCLYVSQDPCLSICMGGHEKGPCQVMVNNGSISGHRAGTFVIGCPREALLGIMGESLRASSLNPPVQYQCVWGYVELMSTDKMSTDKMSTDKMSNRQNVEQTKCRKDKMSTDKMPNRQNVDNLFIYFFLFFFSYNFSLPKNNGADNSGMPLNANLLKLDSSILPRAKRASSETT